MGLHREARRSGQVVAEALGRNLNNREVIELMTRTAERIGATAFELNWRI